MEKQKDKNTGCGICPCSDPCPLRKAVGMIGGRWKTGIICTLYVDGRQRFGELSKKTKGITGAMLSSSLKELIDDGIVVREQYPEIPPRVEYSLTDRGRSLFPILNELSKWALNIKDETETEG